MPTTKDSEPERQGETLNSGLLDQAWLEEWIRPVHLTSAAHQQYRARFTSQASPWLVIDGFLLEPLAQQVGDFLSQEARYRRSLGLHDVSGEIDESTWQAAPEDQRFYSYRVLDEGQWQDLSSPNVAALIDLRKALRDPRFAAFAAEVTGMTFGTDTEVGTHGLAEGDFLKWHRDIGNNRRLAFLLYLSPDWRPQYGGALHLVDTDGVEERIEPRFNRLLVFDVVANQGHWVGRVTPPQGRLRLSVGGWLHAP